MKSYLTTDTCFRSIRFHISWDENGADSDPFYTPEETRLAPIKGVWIGSVCGAALWAIIIGLAWMAWRAWS
jgi:hypothetical protein